MTWLSFCAFGVHISYLFPVDLAECLFLLRANLVAKIMWDKFWLLCLVTTFWMSIFLILGVLDGYFFAVLIHMGYLARYISTQRQLLRTYA